MFQLVLPEYLIHVFFCVMFLCAAEWLTLALNMPLLAYHVYRWVGLSHLSQPIILLILYHFWMRIVCLIYKKYMVHVELVFCVCVCVCTSAGTQLALWWAALVSMIPPPSWMLISWHTVRRRDGANLPSTCCPSSIISMGQHTQKFTLLTKLW